MNRKLLKDNAKIALKRNFCLVMLVVLVAQFLGVTDVGGSAGYSGGSGGSSYSDTNDDSNDWDDDLFDDSSDWDDGISFNDNGMQQMSHNDVAQVAPMSTIEDIATAIGLMSVGFIVAIFVAVIVAAFIWSVFLTNPIQVGYRRFFMLNRSSQGKFVDLFSAFCPKYMNIVKGMLTTNLIIFGWSLLFIIPGIIKSYQYFFVPFILCENPEISGERAREISKNMTDGYKFKIFVLGLSFIGWELLAFLLSIPAALATCCFMGIGASLVYVPLGGYVSATYAELYEERREYALCINIASSTELCGFEPKVES